MFVDDALPENRMHRKQHDQSSWCETTPWQLGNSKYESCMRMQISSAGIVHVTCRDDRLTCTSFVWLPLMFLAVTALKKASHSTGTCIQKITVSLSYKQHSSASAAPSSCNLCSFHCQDGGVVIHEQTCCFQTRQPAVLLMIKKQLCKVAVLQLYLAGPARMNTPHKVLSSRTTKTGFDNCFLHAACKACKHTMQHWCMQCCGLTSPSNLLFCNNSDCS